MLSEIRTQSPVSPWSLGNMIWKQAAEYLGCLDYLCTFSFHLNGVSEEKKISGYIIYINSSKKNPSLQILNLKVVFPEPISLGL